MQDEEHESEEHELSLDAPPIQVCASALGRLSEIWDDIGNRTGRGEGKFFEEVFGRFWDDGDTGEQLEGQLRRWEEQPEDMQKLALLQVMFTSTAYACQGMKAQKDGDMARAWQYTARCEFWLGLAVGTWAMRSTQGNPGSEFAKIGAAARHKENREMKAQVLAQYAESGHEMPSKDAFAEAVAGKLVPAKFRAVRRWLNNA